MAKLNSLFSDKVVLNLYAAGSIAAGYKKIGKNIYLYSLILSLTLMPTIHTRTV